MFKHVTRGAAQCAQLSTHAVYLMSLLFLTFAIAPRAHAASSTLSITCEDRDMGAKYLSTTNLREMSIKFNRSRW
ncbi:MAG: hypothetical protein IPP36_11460 [Nitrosomonadales bacterium]|nr:hypothetical protein [Nitrosomonadales bacterium]